MVGVGRLARRHHAPGRARLVHHHDLDPEEVIRGQAVLPAQEAEGTAQDVTAHAEGGTLAGRDRDSPAQEQLAVRLAERRARLRDEGAPARVVVDGAHQAGVDHDAHRRVGHEALQAVPSAAHHEPQALAHGVLHGLHHVLGGADEADVVGPAPEPLVEIAADELGVAWILRPDPVEAHVVTYRRPPPSGQGRGRDARRVNV